MKYGTYTTLDCPTKKQNEALAFLQSEFSKIEGNVRVLYNPHDLGAYPSFEIDYPERFDVIDDIDEKDNWHEIANSIYGRYSKKFNDYL